MGSLQMDLQLTIPSDTKNTKEAAQPQSHNSFKSIASWRSYRSTGSALSCFSIGTFFALVSFMSVASVLSIGSVSSVLSIFSTSSALSMFSLNSVLSIGCNPQTMPYNMTVDRLGLAVMGPCVFGTLMYDWKPPNSKCGATGLELLCGSNCSDGVPVTCQTYNGKQDKCELAVELQADGSKARCVLVWGKDCEARPEPCQAASSTQSASRSVWTGASPPREAYVLG